MSRQKEDEVRAGCLLVIFGFVIVGLSFGWTWAFGILGILVIALGIMAILGS